MADLKQMDYNTKILNFLTMTETGDQEVAIQYLSSVNWDETKAVNKFFSKIKPNSSRNSNNNNNSNNISNRISTDNDSIQNNNEEGILGKFFSSICSLFNSCTSNNNREIDSEEENRIFQFLPNKVNDFIRFNNLINKYIGIIIFYNGKNISFLNRFITQICRNTMLINLLKEYFIFFPLLEKTEESEKTQNLININNLIYPAFVFCYKKSNDDLNLNKNNVLNLLQSETITLDVFQNALYDCLEKINKKQNLINIDKSLGAKTDAEVLEKQKKDMEALEREQQKKEEEIKKEKINEELKQKEIEKKANEAKKKIVDEPSKDDPNSTTICFRFPDGEKRIDRRFLKNNKIQNLYDFVTSLGKEIYNEEGNNSFSLYQPFPPKKYENMDNTLEEEGLFPNAIIQIREE